MMTWSDHPSIKRSSGRLRGAKVLQLDSWMRVTWALEACRNSGKYPEMDPIFHRDGWYSHYKFSWFEVGGRAYKADYRDFEYSLAMLTVRQAYNSKQIEALRQAILQRVATKDQKTTVAQWDEVQEQVGIVRRSEIFMRKSLERYEASCKEVQK